MAFPRLPEMPPMRQLGLGPFRTCLQGRLQSDAVRTRRDLLDLDELQFFNIVCFCHANGLEHEGGVTGMETTCYVRNVDVFYKFIIWSL